MTQTPVNIFDFLLGDLSGLPGGVVTGQQASGGEAAGLFSELINSYLTSKGQLGVTDPLSAGKTFGGTDPLTAGKAEAVTESVAEFNRQLLSVLPRQMGVIGANVKDALENSAVELKPGKYEILGSQIENGEVSLSVVSKDNPGRQITLTFPTEALNGLQADKVSLSGDYYQSQYLDNLLAKLNLKEIEVKPAGMQESLEVSHEPLKITVVAEGSTGELLLKGKLDRSRLRASSSDINTPHTKGAEALRTSPKAQFDSDYLQNRLLAGNANGRTQIGTRMLLGENQPFQRLTDFTDQRHSAETQQVYDSLFGYDIASVKDESAGERISSQHIRFTLPDNIASSLKLNGKSVTIRIEPEHLGPAKLSLSMNDDKLKARIVVESAPAKAALESSLDRLVDQLAKADIKVDQIEISINGDSTHNQFLGRQPHWRHRVLPRSTSIEDDSAEQTNIPVLPSAAKTVGYAGPSGVNLLA